MKEVGLSAYHFDTQAFLFAAHDMDRGEFAALDTLQYGLARDAERAHCLAHRQEVLTGITMETILEVFGSPSNWWTPLLNSGGSGKVSNEPGTASFYG